MSFLTLPVPITGAWGSSGQTIMNCRKRLRIYTIVVFSFIRTFAPSF